MDALPGGTAFGTLVHSVLERIDTAAGDLAAEVRNVVGAQVARVGPPGLDPNELTEALLPALQTPLGALVADRCLADIPPSDRLAELDFEMPLRGGDRPNGTSRLGELAALLRSYLPANDPLAPFADMLADPVLGDAVLKGYLAGSIDAVVRIEVDMWSSTTRRTASACRCAADGVGLPRCAMAEAMIQAHYPLQALLYEVALHRFLRWRLVDYDPTHHLGECSTCSSVDVRPTCQVRRWDCARCLRVAAGGFAGDRRVRCVGGGYGVTALHTLRATGLLKEFDEAGLLTPADVHVAMRLGRLASEPDERVLLAIALTVRNTRHGSVVLDLAEAATTITADADDAELVDISALPWPSAEEWVDACAASPVVADAPGGSPVRLVGSRLWLDRYWRQESQVASDLLQRSADRPSDLDVSVLRADLDSLFTSEAEADQRFAAHVAALSRVSVIGGGPGTGKTTTIARLIAALRRQRPNLRIALAAPTGKAAARLEEAVGSATGTLTDADRAGLSSLSASTLHRLLGRRPGVASRFRHDRENRLPFDLVIVDECSMVY
jgi:hypothetical protein